MMRRTAAHLLLAGAAAAPSASIAQVSYVADGASSRLQFIGVQAGAEFTGSFHKFMAAVDLAPDDPATARIDVTIDLDSLDTQDRDRDKTMRGPDIFDVAHYQSAHYVTRSVTKTPSGYSAAGTLTLHGVTKDVPIVFKFQSNGPAATLVGTAQLKRLDFGVGQGDWKSTEWVDDLVKVAFSLALKPKS